MLAEAIRLLIIAPRLDGGLTVINVRWSNIG
jgi:hypothetical protein